MITCNAEGALGRAASADSSTLVLTLPAETNDRSLAMTSSFTSMALSALGLGWPAAELRTLMRPVQEGARRILDEHAETIERFSGREFSRALYLGSNALAGVMHEAALKMLEMTAGRVISTCDSFLGVRHGPQVFVDNRCIVVACLSSVPGVRRYELDLLRELRRKKQGRGVLAISAADDREARGIVDELLVLSAGKDEPVDELRVLTDIVACQVLAFFTSRRLGLMPDNPSPGGVINRVVQGVTIYDP